MNTPNTEVSTAAVTETTKKANSMEFVDFKGGNEYCLEINDNTGKPIVQLLFSQANKWNTPRKPGEPATPPDKSYIVVQVGRITKAHTDGAHEVKKLKKYLIGVNKFNYTYMGKNLKLDDAAEATVDVA